MIQYAKNVPPALIDTCHFIVRYLLSVWCIKITTTGYLKRVAKNERADLVCWHSKSISPPVIYSQPKERGRYWSRHVFDNFDPRSINCGRDDPSNRCRLSFKARIVSFIGLMLRTRWRQSSSMATKLTWTLANWLTWQPQAFQLENCWQNERSGISWQKDHPTIVIRDGTFHSQS